MRVPRKTLINDLIAGFVMAVITVPGAVANGVLAGVNPVFGLYSIIAGTTVAAIFTSSVIMNVDSTSATALATAEAVGGFGAEEQLGYLVVLGMLIGVFMLIFGLLKLGFLVRFISNAVMTGFLSGLGVLTILGQVGDLTGFYSEAGNKLLRVIDTVIHYKEIHPATLIIGGLTITLIILVNRTPFDRYSLVIGLGVSTLFVTILGLDSIAVVGDATEIPRALPIPRLPELAKIPAMLLPALSLSIIALVQAAGVSQSTPNPDGEYPDPSGDFSGQGIANIVAGSTGAIPVGGSLSGTILLKTIGGISRWANIFTGLFGAVIVLLFAPLIEILPMPALAGLLIIIGISMIKTHRIQTVWNTGPVPVTIMLITFTLTLLTPIQVAVFSGVGLHILIYVFRSAESVHIQRILVQPDGSYIEAASPNQLPSNEIVILNPIGNLFFAGAAEFEENLPEIGDAQGSVVIIRLRGRDEVGSTFIRIIKRYTQALKTQRNLLMLVGLNEHVLEQLVKTDLLDLIGEANVFPAEARFGASINEAIQIAKTWMGQGKPALKKGNLE
jgi:SulP family sulfate permease